MITSAKKQSFAHVTVVLGYERTLSPSRLYIVLPVSGNKKRFSDVEY